MRKWRARLAGPRALPPWYGERCPTAPGAGFWRQRLDALVVKAALHLWRFEPRALLASGKQAGSAAFRHPRLCRLPSSLPCRRTLSRRGLAPARFAAFRARYLWELRGRTVRLLAISSHFRPFSPALCLYFVQKQTISQENFFTKAKSKAKNIRKPVRKVRKKGRNTLF